MVCGCVSDAGYDLICVCAGRTATDDGEGIQDDSILSDL